jgi:hypothetical protein
MYLRDHNISVQENYLGAALKKVCLTGRILFYPLPFVDNEQTPLKYFMQSLYVFKTKKL